MEEKRSAVLAVTGCEDASAVSAAPAPPAPPVRMNTKAMSMGAGKPARDRVAPHGADSFSEKGGKNFDAKKGASGKNFPRLSAATAAPDAPMDEPAASAGRKGTEAHTILKMILINLLVVLVCAAIFSNCEYASEVQRIVRKANLLHTLNSSLPAADYTEVVSVFNVDEAMLSRAHAASSAGLELPADLGFHWNGWGSALFCVTIATTVGFGYSAPVTDGGRVFCIFYAIASIPLCLVTFYMVANKVLRFVNRKFSGRDRELPGQVFRMVDTRSRGVLTKAEVIGALPMLGLPDASSSIAARKKFNEAYSSCDNTGSGKLELHQFRKLMSDLNQSDDITIMLGEVVGRGRVALASIATFLIVVGFNVLIFMHVMPEWDAFDAFYFTIITFLTVGLGDLSPTEYPVGAMFFAWLFLLIGLCATAAMVSAMADSKLNMRATLRSIGPLHTLNGRYYRWMEAKFPARFANEEKAMAARSSLASTSRQVIGGGRHFTS